MADRPTVYLVVPVDLADELLSPLREHFAADPHVGVVVERRTEARRAGIDNRILRDVDEQKLAERRAQTVPRGVPDLPPIAQPYADRLHVDQRMTPVRQTELQDLDVLGVVRALQEGDPDAPTELLWRSFDRVQRRLAQHLRDAREADRTAKATFGFIFDRIHDFDVDGDRSFDGFLDRMVDEYALGLGGVEPPAR